MICVYEADCSDFSGNGLGVLTPSECSVTETLNGEWELTLVHPLDDLGKWTRLTEGRILTAPVPAASTPRVNLITQSTGTEIYRVSTRSGTLRLRSGPGTNYKILKSYKKNTELILLHKTSSSWYEVTCPDGKRGYMSTEYLSYVRTEGNVPAATDVVIEPRQLRDQPFRISCENTVEYAQYAHLQSIYLGDSVRVIAPRIGVEVSMRMTQYTYDCLTKKYTSVTLGTVTDTLEGSTISGRQLASGSITGSKIAMNAIGAGQLQSGSVGSLQVKMAAIQTAHVQDAAITKAKIAEAVSY